MKLPISITPNAIVEVVVDIRYDAAVPDDAVLGLVYQPLKADFPKITTLPLASVPLEIRRKDPQLFSQPLHRLEGKHLTINVGPHTVSVSARPDYPGWEVLSDRFRDALALVASAGVIGKPRRFGLRYVSFFEGDIFPNLTLSIAIDGDPLNGQGTLFRTTLRENDCHLLLQVSKDVMLVNKKDQRGSVIDIDTSVGAPNIAEGLDSALTAFLEKAHLAQKKLFFKLLRPEFLSTLHPTYAAA